MSGIGVRYALSFEEEKRLCLAKGMNVCGTGDVGQMPSGNYRVSLVYAVPISHVEVNPESPGLVASPGINTSKYALISLPLP